MNQSPTTVDVETSNRVEVIDITDKVIDSVPAETKHGICTVFVEHTTAGVVVNEPEPRLTSDIVQTLERLVPRDQNYGHDAIDDNADAHLRSMLLGESVTLPLIEGELNIGKWQAVLFVECDGPRHREVDVITLSSST